MLKLKIFRKYLVAIGLGLGIGFLVGLYRGGFYVYSNQYLKYDTYNLALDSLRSSLNQSIAASIVIILCIFTILYFLIFPLLGVVCVWFEKNIGFHVDDKNNFWAFIIAAVLSLFVFFVVGLYINKEILINLLTVPSQIIQGLLTTKIIVANFLAIILCILLIIPFYRVALRYTSRVVHSFSSPKTLSSFWRFGFFGMAFLLIALVVFNAFYMYKKTGMSKNSEDFNLILISIDTLRADHLSSYGYYRNTSPNIDSYAKSGVLFEQAISSTAWTTPAHMSLFTSLSPLRDSIFLYPARVRLRSDYLTLAEVMKESGYITAGFTGGGNVSAEFEFDQGFDIYVSKGRHFEDNRALVYKWLNKNRRNKFFLFLHGFNVHRPYTPPFPFNKKFFPNYDGDFNIEDFSGHIQYPSQKDLQYVISQYDGEISFVDELIKGLFDKLKELKLLENTVIVITSDHGDAFYEHGHVDHTATLYEELIHIPLIVIGPNVPDGVRVNRVVRIVDIMPTVLDLLDIKMPESYKYDLEGISLVSFMHEESGEDIYAFSATGYSEFPYYLYSIRENKWKLIFNNLSGMDERYLKSVHYGAMVRNGKIRNDFANSFELYNLEEDPNEKNNVVNSHSEISKYLKEKLDKKIETMPKGIITEDKMEYSRELQEQLKSLGYIQ